MGSGPVKVTNTFHGFNTGADASKKTMVVTFDAIDGDVPLLHAESFGNPTAGALSTSTITHGSSISGGAGARFEHMEAGGTINITSQETVTFTVPSGGTSNVVVFSYDGIMQSGTGVTLSGAINDGGTLDDALATITDDNGVKVVGAASEVVATHATDTITVTLKKGLSGSKLEMHAVTGGVHTSTTKTVNRNNNGKTFRIKRSRSAVFQSHTLLQEGHCRSYCCCRHYYYDYTFGNGDRCHQLCRNAHSRHPDLGLHPGCYERRR